MNTILFSSYITLKIIAILSQKRDTIAKFLSKISQNFKYFIFYPQI